MYLKFKHIYTCIFLGPIGEKGSIGAPGQPGITGSVVRNYKIYINTNFS